MEKKNFGSKIMAGFKRMNQSIERFTNFLYTHFMTFFRKHYLWLVFAVILVLSFIVRYAFLPFLSGDMGNFLSPWFEYLRANGGFKAMGTYPWDTTVISQPGDYPVGYFNLLALLSYLPGDGVTLIKLSSIFFDYVLAFAALGIIRTFSKNKFLQLIAFTCLVFFPTSILNSAVWGQADQLYVSLIVLTILLLVKKKPLWAMIPLGLALSVKIQTTFFLPVLVFMWLNKKFKLRYFLLAFLVTFMTFVPSYLAGAPFNMPFSMYVNQVTSMYRNANYGSGSLYAFFEMGVFKDGINAGADLALATTLIGITLLFLFHYKVPATSKNIVYVATLFSLVSPFVLPHMHERYFYFADVMLIIYVFVYRRKYFFAFLMSFSSLLTYTHFLSGQYIFKFLGTDSVRLAALINLALIVLVAIDGRHVLLKEAEEFDTRLS